MHPILVYFSKLYHQYLLVLLSQILRDNERNNNEFHDNILEDCHKYSCKKVNSRKLTKMAEVAELRNEIAQLRNEIIELQKQAEQEPVAWISSNCPKCRNKVRGTLGSETVWRCPKCAFEWPVENAAPVHTVDLTDEEIKNIWHSADTYDVFCVEFARAVIAKFKEKNK